jgi:hypothetical protein
VIDWQIHLLEPWLGRDLRDLPPELDELPIAPEVTRANRFGRSISPDLLRNIWYAYYLSDVLPVPVRDVPYDVLEIGGGYGGFARTLKSRCPTARIWLVDLPESLQFAELYLCTAFPGARIIRLDESVSNPSVLDDADFVLVPLEKRAALDGRSFDVAVNIWSFGEMPNSYLDEWFDLLQNRCTTRWIFLLNSVLSPVTAASRPRLDVGDWLLRIDRFWAITEFELNPPIHRCPLVRNFHNGLMIIAQRELDRRNLERRQASAEQALDAVLHQDWVKLSLGSGTGAVCPESHSVISPSLRSVQDQTDYIGFLSHISGSFDPFYCLWNDYRLRSTELSGQLLVVYLGWINKTEPQVRATKEEVWLLRRLQDCLLHREYQALLGVESPGGVMFRGQLVPFQQACDQARALFENGDLLNAREMYLDVAAQASNHAECWFQLASLELMADKRVSVAAAMAQHALNLFPGHKPYEALRERLAKDACGHRAVFTTIGRFFRSASKRRGKPENLLERAEQAMAAGNLKAAEALAAAAFLSGANGWRSLSVIASCLNSKGEERMAYAFQIAAARYV